MKSPCASAPICVRLAACCLVVITLAGCRSAPVLSAEPEAWERRATMVKGTADAHWKAVGDAVRVGREVDAEYVYYLAEARNAATEADVTLRKLPATDPGRAQAYRVVEECEESMQRLIGRGMTETR